MRKAGVWAIYDADVKAAWDVLTIRDDVSWRTDLKKIEYRSVNDDFVDNPSFLIYPKNSHPGILHMNI